MGQNDVHRLCGVMSLPGLGFVWIIDPAPEMVGAARRFVAEG